MNSRANQAADEIIALFIRPFGTSREDIVEILNKHFPDETAPESSSGGVSKTVSIIEARMSAINDGGPAFPQPNHVIDTDRGREEARGWMSDSGMTLRDYFAAKAMQANMSSDESMKWFMSTAKNNQSEAYAMIAKDSYIMADAMLAARNAERDTQ